MDRETLLRRVILTCRDFIRDVAYHRAMLPYTGNLRTNIWIYTFNNFLNMAILNWCHLFGNSKDDLHWLKIIDDSDAFRDKLLETVGVNLDDWKIYRKTVVDYRNKDVAHIEVRPEGHAPQLDNAITAASFYYNAALEELKTYRPYADLPDDLNQHYSEVSELANKYVTNHIVEKFEYTEQT